MCKRKSFEYSSILAEEFNNFLQYRISGGSNGLEERRVLKCLDDYLLQSGRMQKILDGTIIDSWIDSLNSSGSTKAHYVSTYRQLAYYLIGSGLDAYIPLPLRTKHNYTPYIFTHDEIKRLFEVCDNIPTERSLTGVQG